MTDPRSQHPFWMREEIHEQPDAVAAALTDQAEGIARMAAALRAARPRRLFLVGTGTSFHAAQCAAWFARLEHVPLTTMAVPAHDFVTYPIALTSDDAVVVISHRGTKHYTGKALELARAAKVVTGLVTGQGPHEAPAGVVVLRTCHQDRSSAHTVSYTSALAVLMLLLADYADCSDDERLRRVILDLPTQLAAALQTEAVVRELAERYAGRQRVYFVGGGPHAVTASEAALKVKETSYIVSEGFAVEQMLHGPMQAVEASDLVVAVAPSGPSTQRIGDLLNAANEIGAARIAVMSGGESLNADASIQIPPTRESLSPLTSVVALQLFAYWAAVTRGKNPDCFRLDEPRYKRASGRFAL
ncbi:MAG: SIS domain-containing protein [Deltaproteobacteria bacterium]|nr:SIS domain-containing protein [Deltaproteobacteria bacterium]MBI3387346.1 SIS domain-containing protein [Deltaproteobacteria bacterium]